MNHYCKSTESPQNLVLHSRMNTLRETGPAREQQDLTPFISIVFTIPDIVETPILNGTDTEHRKHIAPSVLITKVALNRHDNKIDL